MTEPSDWARRIRDELDQIIDPCSLRAGVPAGIASMGIVRAVEVQPDEMGRVTVSVTLSMTEPSCLMGWPFAQAAEQRISALDGVAAVCVHLDNSVVWEPGDMSAEYQQRLSRARASSSR
jgi:metal-sulfur cluster biosynthetic enzyme